MTLPDLATIERAASFIYSVMPPTPQYSWPLLNQRAGAEVWVKHENHTPLGAFKIRSGLVYFRNLRESGYNGSVAVTATHIVKEPFWALSTEWMSAGVAAAAIAQVNAIGNLGGFFGSYVLGVIKDATGTYALGLLPLAALSAVGCGLVVILGHRQEQPRSTSLSGVH